MPKPIWPARALEIIRLLPVNSSAPAITTSISPRLKATPAMNREKLKPNTPGSKLRVAASMPPKPMYAPASTPRTNTDSQGEVTLPTPTF